MRRAAFAALTLLIACGGLGGPGLGTANRQDLSGLMVKPVFRKTSMCWASGTSAVFSECVGEGAATVTGTASTQPTISNYMLFIRHQTAASTNAIAGINSQGVPTNFRINWRPKLSFTIMTDTAVTLRRTWYGMVPSTIETLTHADSGLTGAQFCALGFDTSISSAWRMCAADKVNYTCNDITGSTVVADTEYVLTVDYSVAGKCTFTVQNYVTGAAFTGVKTDNLPADNAIGMHPIAITVTLEDVAKNQNTSLFVFERN